MFGLTSLGPGNSTLLVKGFKRRWSYVDIEVALSLGSRLIPYLFFYPSSSFCHGGVCIIWDLVYTGSSLDFLPDNIYFM